MTAHRRDVLTASGLALGAALVSWFVGRAIEARGVWNVTNFWFEADIPRVIDQMLHLDPNRSDVHPLFAPLTFPAAWALTAVGLSTQAVIGALIAATAGALVATFFTVLRILGCRWGDAVLLSTMVATSSGSLFFSSVPEVFALGGLSLLVMMAVVAAEERRPVPAGWSLGAAVAAWGITITNGMAVLATVLGRRWKRSLGIAAGSLAVVVLISVVLSGAVPGYRVPGFDVEHEPMFILPDEAGGPVRITASFLIHGMIAPEVEPRRDAEPGYPIMSMQRSLPGSGTIPGALGVAAWAGLLGLGVAALVRLRTVRRFRLILGATLLGQLALHLVYGEETFLYSMHYVPLLGLVVGLATLTRARPVVIVLAPVVSLLAAVNNAVLIGETLGRFPGWPVGGPL